MREGKTDPGCSGEAFNHQSKTNWRNLHPQKRKIDQMLKVELNPFGNVCVQWAGVQGCSAPVHAWLHSWPKNGSQTKK